MILLDKRGKKCGILITWMSLKDWKENEFEASYWYFFDYCDDI